MTLVLEPDAVTLGMAYRVRGEVFDDVIARLDHREKGGYERHEVELHTLDGEVVRALVYLASKENESYLGPAAPEEIAAQIVRSRGPSGPNDEYLLRLEAWLREMGEQDAHVFELAALVRRLARTGRSVS